MSLAGPVSDIATEGPIPNRQTDVSANNGRRIIICAFILFSRRIVHSGSWKLKRARQRRPQRDQSRMSKAFLTHFMSNLGAPKMPHNIALWQPRHSNEPGAGRT